MKLINLLGLQGKKNVGNQTAIKRLWNGLNANDVDFCPNEQQQQLENSYGLKIHLIPPFMMTNKQANSDTQQVEGGNC